MNSDCTTMCCFTGEILHSSSLCAVTNDFPSASNLRSRAATAFDDTLMDMRLSPLSLAPSYLFGALFSSIFGCSGGGRPSPPAPRGV